MAGIWRCRSRRLPLDRTLVMGVLNVTPDSFYDGGRYSDLARAVGHGLAMVEAGADVVDVGGESTRPGAATVPDSEEIRRTVPVVERLVAEGVCVSIDTRKPVVAREAVEAGAAVVNDVSAGLYVRPGQVGDDRGLATLRVAAREGCGLVLMHMRGEPATMQEGPSYDDVVADVRGFLEERVRAARLEGCEPETIAVDPGIGFGKTLGHNLSLLGCLDELAELGLPVLVGTSRKSMFAHLLDLPASDRLVPSLATAVTAVLLGASIVRTHDVPETVAAVRWADDLRLLPSLSPDA
ncbi:MAG: dihydropteroate synthase [Actinobacteria bacterium ATB1]|nr:dihydropteroate synthase [Actinobacteria bacterium ATB1]